MAWDDRRQTFRMPKAADTGFATVQRYFRACLKVLGVGAAALLALFLVLAFYAATGR